MSALQWGGRFGAAPDAQLLAFGTSIEEDLVLAPFDVECSLGHVEALRGGKIVSEAEAAELASALAAVGVEIRDGSFANYARAARATDAKRQSARTNGSLQATSKNASSTGCAG